MPSFAGRKSYRAGDVGTKNYWRHLRRQARKETREALFGSVEQAVIEGFGYLIWLAAVYGVLSKSSVALHDELAIGILASAFPILIYPVLYFYKLRRLPPRLQRKFLRRAERQRAKIVVLQGKLESKIELFFDASAYGIEFEKDGPLRHVISIGVANDTGHALNKCQIWINPRRRGGDVRPVWARFAVCEPFDMVTDATKFVGLFSYDFDNPESELKVTHWADMGGGRWEIYPGHMSMLLGDYDLHIEALAENARRARFSMLVSHANGRWSFVPQ